MIFSNIRYVFEPETVTLVIRTHQTIAQPLAQRFRARLSELG